jgi:hypothetical protein
MSLEAFVEAAQAVLKAGGLGTTFRRGDGIAMYRHESSDRHIEVVARDAEWSVSCTHVESKKNQRLRGRDVAGLEAALRPWCADVAFEPAVGDPDKFRRR